MSTMEAYKKNDDLLGAYARFQATSKSWASRWWACVEEIYTTSKKWCHYYVIDPIKRTIRQITRGRARKFFIEDVLDFNGIDPTGCGAYIVDHANENNEQMWIKCGKADEGKTRLAQHFTRDYSGKVFSGKLLAWYPCKNSNHALTVENIIRDHFEKKGFALLGNDRFPELHAVTEEDFAELERKIKIVEEIF